MRRSIPFSTLGILWSYTQKLISLILPISSDTALCKVKLSLVITQAKLNWTQYNLVLTRQLILNTTYSGLNQLNKHISENLKVHLRCINDWLKRLFWFLSGFFLSVYCVWREVRRRSSPTLLSPLLPWRWHAATNINFLTTWWDFLHSLQHHICSLVKLMKHVRYVIVKQPPCIVEKETNTAPRQTIKCFPHWCL